MLRILAALDPYVEQTAPRGRESARWLRGLVLVLRYTGMRIGDAVQLRTDQINGNKLFLYQQKAGVPVYTALPSFIVAALESIPRVSETRFFWGGSSSLDAVVGSWQKRLRTLFRLAKVINGHAHRFRDTFAVELLLGGVSIKRVSILLGHQSIKITERHYSPWRRSRQEQVEADLQRAWDRDPIVLLETKGTREVRGENGRPN
jgi:integrase/recombinase XerD